MKKLVSSLLWMVVSLGLITAIAAAVLSYVHEVTEVPIADVERQKKTEAIAEVVPPFDNDPMTDTWVDSESGCTVYIAKKGKNIVGGAVESYSPDGFSGRIDVIFGFDAEGTVTGYRVIKHAETPGLGAKMEQWFRDPQGRRAVIGRNPSVDNMAVAKDGGDVDGITAATISSRAFLDALRRGYESFKKSNNTVR